ncbi:unnamed protein product [Parnassius apollo]|nr:unnamed protein product [Parnassius apollo]
MLSENRWKVILLVAASVAAVESSRALSIVYQKPRTSPMFVPKHLYRRSKQSRVLFLDEDENNQPFGRGEIDLTTDKYSSKIKFDDSTDYEFTSSEDAASSTKTQDNYPPSGNERFYEPLPRFRPPPFQVYPKYYQGRFGRPYAPSYGFDPYSFAPAVRNGFYGPTSGWKARSPRVVFPYASDSINSVQTNSHVGPNLSDNVVFRDQSIGINDIGAEEQNLQDIGTGSADAFAERDANDPHRARSNEKAIEFRENKFIVPLKLEKPMFIQTEVTKTMQYLKRYDLNVYPNETEIAVLPKFKPISDAQMMRISEILKEISESTNVHSTNRLRKGRLLDSTAHASAAQPEIVTERVQETLERQDDKKCFQGGTCEFFMYCWMVGGLLDGSCGGLLKGCCHRNSKAGILGVQDSNSIDYASNEGLSYGPVINDESCGIAVNKQTAQRRIVGGDDAGFGTFPWQAYIRIGSSRCGGSLISRRHVVTAGHCVARAQPRHVRVTLGDYVINSAAEPLPAYTFGVRTIKVHPLFKFTPQADRFDVAVLTLDRNVHYMPHIAPICLPERGSDFLGQYGWAAGWGALSPGSRLRPRTLQAVDVPVLDNRVCERWHRANGINVVIYPEMLCAGYRGGGKDSCQGDSGGPLMLERAGRWYLIGVVSAGYSCASRGQPGIYHRVAHTSDQKRLSKSLERPEVCGAGPGPDQADTVAFWRGLWSEPVNHSEGPWMEVVASQSASVTPMDPVTITPEDVAEAVRRAPNWKGPGLDGLYHYWLKGFVVCHAVLARQFQEALDQKSLPSLFTTGITHLVPKYQDTTDPSKYRPITCLPTIYKTLTSILSSRITRHLELNQVMSRAQNRCRGGGRGTKEPLLIDAVISKVVKRNRRNFSAAWIDYRKAFDSVPHTWLKRVLQLYKIDCTVGDILEQCMGQWSTILCYLGERMMAAENHIRIRRGRLSESNLFCLSLNPLSTLLEGSGRGFQLRKGGTKVIHLFYMDDLKLFASSRSHLMELLNITCEFSSSIGMELGTDKCAVLHVERGRVANSEGIYFSMPVNLRTLSEAETYRYLGMSQNIGIDEAGMKQSVCDVFYARLTKVLNNLLSGVNKTHAYNGGVMPVLMYTFGILRWTQTELNALDRKVRTTMTSHRMQHPRSSVMRLYLPRKHGGRGFLSALTMHNREVCSLRDYFLARSDDPFYNDVISSDKGLTTLSLANEQWQDPAVLSIFDRETVWKENELHGRFYKALHEPFVDTVASVPLATQWRSLRGNRGTELVCAIQDQVIKTNNYRRYILKDGTVDICRACRHPGESLRRVISGCSALSNSDYLHRHNLVARILHQELALKYGLVDRKLPYYKYLPEAVLENDRARLYWDRAIITDRTILANKPDIVLMDRVQSRIFLVDITIPYDENLVKAETHKQTKYLDLAHESASRVI